MTKPIDLTKLKVLPLSKRRSLARLDEILIDPQSPPAPCPPHDAAVIRKCAARITEAREREASVMMIYGAHLIKNGAASIVRSLLEENWLTHLATNGAGAIHDWEFAFGGVSTESVKDNVATGTFGVWDETGRNFQLALLAGGLKEEGFGSRARKVRQPGRRDVSFH